ncbi:MAG: hypothetical protein GY700_06370 [Propionibacteriaceae bacterium]|nr:hypothetical protein [Propionibacteriaceae bacterium]
MRRLNAGQIIDAALDDVLEPTSSGFVKPATALRWLNEAQEEVVLDLGDLGPQGRSELQSITGGQQEYPIPATTTFLLAVWWYDGSDWERLHYTPYELQGGEHYDTESSKPHSYYIRNNMLGLMPIPSDSGSDLIRIDDVFTPVELTARTDYPFSGHEIFQRFNPMLQKYIAMKMFQRQQSWNVAREYQALWEQDKQRTAKTLRMTVHDATARGLINGRGRWDFGEGSLNITVPSPSTPVSDYSP